MGQVDRIDQWALAKVGLEQEVMKPSHLRLVVAWAETETPDPTGTNEYMSARVGRVGPLIGDDLPIAVNGRVVPPHQIKQRSNGGNPFQAFVAFAFFLCLEERRIHTQGRKQGQRGAWVTGSLVNGSIGRNQPIQVATGIGTKSENEYGMSFFDLDPENAGEFLGSRGQRKFDPPP